MRVKFVPDQARFARALEVEAARLARTARRAVNELAWRGVEDLRDGIRKAFDRPTPYVINGATVRLARGDENVAEVEWKNPLAAGPGAERVLRAEIEGGQRRMKRFEKLLGLPANRVAVPGKWAELDSYGNISSGQLTKILSDLQLFGEVGYLANRNAKRKSRRARRRERYFMIRVGTEHETLWPGIYRIAHEMGGAPLLVIAFVRAARYRPRLAPAVIIQESVARNAAEVWQLALERRLPERTGSGSIRGTSA